MEGYELFNQLSATVSDIAYCCNKNHCYTQLNQLTATKEANLDQTLKLITDKHVLLQESISKVSSKVEELNVQNSELKARIDNLAKDTTDSVATPSLKPARTLSPAEVYSR